MSIRLMSQVWEDTRIDSQSELLVLLALADHARDDGLCWPSMRSIAVKARIEERSAQRIVRRLIEKGLIELVSQGGCIDGCNTPNRYRVVVGEPRQTYGATGGHPAATAGQDIRGDLASPRGDPEGSKGVTQSHPNHQIEPLTERITTTYPLAPEKLSQRSEPTQASSSRRNILAVGAENSPVLLAPRTAGLVNRLAAEFGLSNKQRQVLREYCDARGLEYVSAKAEIVRSQPRSNAGGALFAALRDNWQPPVRSGPSADTDDLARRMGWQW
jgi:hypothetical protein